MIIKKYTYFYAAHRNEELNDKCSNIHGHCYKMDLYFKVKRSGSITTLFSDLEDKFNPIIKGKYDHGMMININDPLYKIIKPEFPGFKLIEFNEPTSVENLCKKLFGEILETGLSLVQIDLKETESSTIIYTIHDYNEDLGLLRNTNLSKTSGTLEMPTKYIVKPDVDLSLHQMD